MEELITATLTLIAKLVETSDSRQARKNVRHIKKNRRKIYKVFKKNGFTDEEKRMLAELDHAWVEATLKLGKF